MVNRLTAVGGKLPRAAALLAPFGIGLVFAVLFVLSMTTATKSLHPHDLPIGLVAPTPVADRVESSLDTHAPGAFAIHRYNSETEARAAVRDNREYGAFVLTARGARLLLAGAHGAATTTVIRAAFTGVAAGTHVPLTVQDVRPMPSSDSNGTLAGVLLIPLILASLVAAVLGFLLAPWVPAAARVGLIMAYAVIVGLSVTLTAEVVEGGLSANFLEVSAVPALFVLTMATTVAWLQRIAGAAGTGIAVLLLLVLGVPAAGVFAPAEFLPDFYRLLSTYLPTAAGETLIRDVLYLGGDGAAFPITVLSIWAGTGIVLMLLADLVLPRGRARRRPPARPDSEALLAAMIYVAIRRRDPDAPIPDAVRTKLDALREPGRLRR